MQLHSQGSSVTRYLEMIMSCAVVLSTAPFEVGKRPILAVFGIFGGRFSNTFHIQISMYYSSKEPAQKVDPGLWRGIGRSDEVFSKFSAKNMQIIRFLLIFNLSHLIGQSNGDVL